MARGHQLHQQELLKTNSQPDQENLYLLLPPTIEVVKEKPATPDEQSNQIIVEEFNEYGIANDITEAQDTVSTPNKSSENTRSGRRETAVFADDDIIEATHVSVSGGQENCNPSSNRGGTGSMFATHVQTESVLSSQGLTRSERFMSKESIGQMAFDRFQVHNSVEASERSKDYARRANDEGSA